MATQVGCSSSSFDEADNNVRLLLLLPLSKQPLRLQLPNLAPPLRPPAKLKVKLADKVKDKPQPLQQLAPVATCRSSSKVLATFFLLRSRLADVDASSKEIRKL